jgi:uncharacterized membrane protein SpoIIM required for sporulation/ABC-type transport system involved in multi-copper enzyme maturation permease subunit
MFDSLRPALVITRREMRDQFRDWRIIIPIFILTIIFPSIMNFAAQSAVNFVERFGADLVAERLIPFLLMVVGFFPISISMVIALESFVGEKERRSIEPLLSSPISDWQLYAGKLFAVVVPPLLSSYMGIAIYLYGVFTQIGWTAEPVLILQILLLTTVQAFVMVAGAVVISTQATSVRAANLLASFIIIPMSFVIQGESMVMFWAQYDALWWVILGMLVLTGLLVRTGVSHFNREEMLGREMDVLQLGGSWRFFWAEVTGGRRSPSAWYRHAVFPTLKKMRLAVLFMGIAAVGAIWVGTTQAEIYPIPPEAFDLNNLELETFSRLGNIDLLNPGTSVIIWLINLRAIVISLVLGVITFGIMGILALMLPLMLVGYFMANLATAGISPGLFLSAFIFPHGILEIPALLLSAATLLQLGARIAAPSQGRNIGQAWLKALADWTKIMLGLVMPLLLGAAILEVFLTPRVALWLLG